MIKRICFTAAAAGTCLVLLSCANLQSDAPTPVAEHRVEAPTHQQTRVYLARLSISPETACAAGITAEQAATLFQTAADTLDALAPSFQTTDSSVATARLELSNLRTRAASQLDTGLEPMIRQAEATLSSALAAQCTLWQSAFETTIAPLPESQRTLLAALRVNAQQGVPTEFKVVTRTPQEWATLQKALQHVRSREACKLQPTSDKSATVAQAAADQTVYAAKQRLDTNLTALRAAWTATTTEQP
jgi:hypothetical protein